MWTTAKTKRRPENEPNGKCAKKKTRTEATHFPIDFKFMFCLSIVLVFCCCCCCCCRSRMLFYNFHQTFFSVFILHGMVIDCKWVMVLSCWQTTVCALHVFANLLANASINMVMVVRGSFCSSVYPWFTHWLCCVLCVKWRFDLIGSAFGNVVMSDIAWIQPHVFNKNKKWKSKKAMHVLWIV